MAMFGAIVSGRLVQTDFIPVDETKLLLNIADADNLNYLVVFLTGAVSLPVDTAAAVYWSWPDPNAPSKWQYLGHISNQKPSAIFKISSLKKLHEMETHDSMMMFGESAISHIAQVGISLEPIASVLQQTPATTAENYHVFGKRMLDNFVNFVSSFTVSPSQMESPGGLYVPLNVITTWFNNFQRRLEQNPNFWK